MALEVKALPREFSFKASGCRIQIRRFQLSR